MLADPQVMYAWEHTFSDGQIWDWLKKQGEYYHQDGVGYFAAVDKASGELVGQIGLHRTSCPDEGSFEVCYMLKRRCFHRGYAVEGVEAMVEYAFDRLGLTAVYAQIKTDNAASIKVAERTGFTRQSEFVKAYLGKGMPHYLYVRNACRREEPDCTRQEGLERSCRIVTTPVGLLRLEEDAQGICALRFVDRGDVPMKRGQKGAYLADAERQLSEYFAGRRREFDVPLSVHGSEFQRRVWTALRSIPYGETCSYQQVAQLTGNGKAARAVGMANHRNPIAILIPCHRVVGKNGKLVGYAGGMERKRYLLDLEAGRL